MIGGVFRLIGVNPRKIFHLKNFPKYISNYRIFKKMGGIVTDSYPILDEFSSQAGIASGHYFHQDLLVASFVQRSNPTRHIDIGSRIDGFVAHVAAFREIEVMDLRDLPATGHDNIKFVKADLMFEDPSQTKIADSISCLHAIEHFGLGRYGDPIDPNGHIKGFNNILKMLKDDGLLYVSFPIGTRNRVYFNAHRVFHPMDILSWAGEGCKVELIRFDYVDESGKLHKNSPLDKLEIEPDSCCCGIYTLRKVS